MFKYSGVKDYLSKLYAVTKLSFYKLMTILTNRKWGWLNDTVYDNKKIIVIGPASCSLTYMAGEEIDKFDIIVRINKSPLTIKGNEHLLGSRTDVLYHCCDEDHITGGGPLDIELIRRQRTRFVVYTYADNKVAYNYYKAVLRHPDINFVRVRANFYKTLKSRYNSKMPTTGLQALNHILNSNFRELHITGFTFFKTPYANGYRDEYRSAEQASHLASSQGNHDPDDELRLFKELYCHVKLSKNIRLDSQLIGLLCQDG